MNEISDKKVELLLTLAREGKSIREMAYIAGVSRQTAQNYQQAYRQVREDEGMVIKKNKGGYWKQSGWACHDKEGYENHNPLFKVRKTTDG